jgi:serine/threonine protein kinase
MQKADSAPYISTWLSPVKLSNPLSYIWNSRSGRLLRSSTEYKFVERRGSSFTSTVWKAIYRPQNSNIEKIVALKKVTIQASPTDTWREAMILDKLEHRNILKMEGVLRDTVAPGNDNPSDFVVLPFIPFDLEFVMSDPVVFRGKANHIRYILYQLLSALYYMHSGDICHRDVKPTSILLGKSYYCPTLIF